MLGHATDKDNQARCPAANIEQRHPHFFLLRGQHGLGRSQGGKIQPAHRQTGPLTALGDGLNGAAGHRHQMDRRLETA